MIAIFATSEKELLSKSFFVKLRKRESTMLADSFTNFDGVVSMFMIFSNLFM